MPKYIYAFFGVMSFVMFAMLGLVWLEFSSFKGTAYAATQPADGSVQGVGGATAAAASPFESSLNKMFTSAQPDYPVVQTSVSVAQSQSAAGFSQSAGVRQGGAQGLVGPLPESQIPQIPASGSPEAQADSAGNYTNAKSASGGMGRSETFSRALPPATTAPKAHSAGVVDTPELENEDDSARTFSVFGVQPSTNQKSPLGKSEAKNDDSKAAVEQGIKPAVEKRKTVMTVAPEYEYGLSTELPKLGQYMPARQSTEQMAADILCDELRSPVMPKLAQPPAPTGDAALRNDFRQWTVTVRPKWRRTDYCPAQNLPSSKIDVFSLQAQITYAISDLELSAIPLIERDDVSGASDHDSFTRMGVAVSPVYRLMRQQRGSLFDFNIGMDAFGVYNVGDYSYVKNVSQFGGGAGLSARRTLFDFIQLGGGMSMHRSNRDAGDLGGNFNLYDFNLYAGFLLGDKWSLTPNFTYYNAQNENLPLQSWTDTELDLSFAMSKAMVLSGVAGFHTDPLESYYFRTSLGLQF